MITHTEFYPTNINSGTLEEKAQAMNSRIQAFNLFFQAFQPTLDVIYYPGSSIDTSPSNTEGFKNSKVIYLDTEQTVIQTLKGEHHEAYRGKAENFDPGPVDLLLLLNFYEEKPLEYVVENGYVICNDYWTGTLDKMLRKSAFKFVGVFTDENQELRTDEETLREETGRINSQTFGPNRDMANLFVFRKE